MELATSGLSVGLQRYRPAGQCRLKRPAVRDVKHSGAGSEKRPFFCHANVGLPVPVLQVAQQYSTRRLFTQSAFGWNNGSHTISSCTMAWCYLNDSVNPGSTYMLQLASCCELMNAGNTVAKLQVR